MADLAFDDGARVRGERHAPPGIEPPDRLQQADHPLLDEVVGLVDTARVPGGDAANEIVMPDHEGPKRLGIVVVARGDDEPRLS
jgi:hypothetical protein